MIPCSWKQTTGLDCPSCGMQRSADALVHGQLAESFHYFPALIPFVALIVFAILHMLKPQKIKTVWILYSLFLTVGLMIGNWIYKMF